MVDEINKMLQDVGSKFRTEDGTSIVMFVRVGRDSIVFLRRCFDNPMQCLEFVKETVGKGNLI